MENIDKKIEQAKNNNNTVVEIPLDELQDLISAYKKCKTDKEKLLIAIQALNDQIDEYNKKFGG